MTYSNNLNRSIKRPNSGNEKKSPILDDEVTVAIANKIIPTIPAPEVAQRIKAKLMKSIENNKLRFIFAKQSKWNEVYPGVKVKLLREENNTKSMMVEMAENSIIPEHIHTQNEESLVLKGDVYIEGILCIEGDYHFAPTGSHHQPITTKNGCTLLVKNF